MIYIWKIYFVNKADRSIYIWKYTNNIMYIYIFSIQQRFKNNSIEKIIIDNIYNIYNMTDAITIENNNTINKYQKNITLYQNIKKYILLISITMLMIGFIYHVGILFILLELP